MTVPRVSKRLARQAPACSLGAAPIPRGLIQTGAASAAGQGVKVGGA
jgi:hypothetical protein